MGMQNPVEASLRTDVQALVSQDWNDLPWWQCRKFRLVAGQQDALAFLLAEAVRHMAMATGSALYDGTLL